MKPQKIPNLKAIFEPHMLELDSNKLTNLDLILGKKKFQREYEIIERKIILSTKFNHNNNNTSEKNKINSPAETEKKYYSDYKFFRNYLTSNFNFDEINADLSEVQILLESSKKMREDIEKYFSKKAKNETDFFKSKDKDSFMQEKHKTVRIDNNNVEDFNLLKKKEIDQNVKEETFRFYSELDNPSDVYSILISDNNLHNKFISFNKKLEKAYHMEEFFSEYALEYNKPEKSNTSIPKDIRVKIPIECVDSFFKSRGKETFSSLDSFMVKYDREHKNSLREKDLFENIYGILSKCDNSNFLSFLYSKNEDFKYIYDSFAKKNTRKTFEGLDLSNISNDSNMKGEKNPQNFTLNLKARRNSFKSFGGYDDLLGHFYFDKINFFPESLDERLFKYLTNSKEFNTNLITNEINKSLITYTKNLFAKDNKNLLLFTKNKGIKIIPIEEQNLLRVKDIEESIKKLMVYRVDKNLIGEKAYSSFNSKEMDYFNNSQFYILEIKNKFSSLYLRESPKNQRSSLDLINPNQQFTYFLIRLNNDNTDRFEIACDTLKLYIPVNDRDNNAFKKIKSDKNDKNVKNYLQKENTENSRNNSPYKVKETEDGFNSEELIKEDIRESEIKQFDKIEETRKKTTNKNGRLSDFNKDFLEKDDYYYLEKTINMEKKNINNETGGNYSVSNNNEDFRKDNKKLSTINQRKIDERKKDLNIIQEENSESNPNIAESEGKEDIVLKTKFLFKLNNTQHNFYLKNDNNNPRIEYSEHNNNMTKKKILYILDVEDYSASESKNKKSGIIMIYKKNGEKMELYTYNDMEDYYLFIEELEKNKVKKKF